MKKLFMTLLLGLLIADQPSVSNAAEEIGPTTSLKGTVWTSAANPVRLAVDRAENFKYNNGRDIYIYFLSPLSDGYLIKVHWRNEREKSDVSVPAMLSPKGQNSFSYIGAFQPPNGGVSGTQGHGTFTIIDKNSAELTLVGRQKDGTTSTFTTALKRLGIRLDTPLARTRPPAR